MSGTQTVTLVVTPPDPEVVTVQREIVEVRLGPIAGPPGPPGDGGGGGTVDSVARAAITSHTEETTAAHGGIVASTDPRLTDARDPKAHTQAITTITGLEDALGSKANTADLATVAETGSYSDLADKPLLGSAATADVEDFASAAQGSAADSAVQPGDLAAVATSGDYDDLTGKPSIPATAADVGAVPTGRTINGKPLSANVTLTAADVGATDPFTVAAAIGGEADARTAADGVLQTQIDALRPGQISQVSWPAVFAHRGGAGVGPENTIPAMQLCVAAGLPGLEMDVVSLGDGTIALMHDDTVDRTTNGTGPVTDYSVESWVRLNAAADIVWPNVVPPPTMEEVCQLFGGKAPMWIEPKDTGDVAGLCDVLDRYGLQDAVVIQATSDAKLTAAKARGYLCYRMWGATPPAGEIAWAVANGADYLGGASSMATASITEMVNTGKPVIMWTVDRRHRWAELQALGVAGVYSDQPTYLNRTTAVRKKDSWDLGFIPSGTLRYGALALSVEAGGVLRVGGASQHFVCIGEVSPIAGTSYQIDVEIRFPSGTGAGAIGIGLWPDDKQYSTNAGILPMHGDGWYAYVRETGVCTLYKTTAPTTTAAPAGNLTTTAIAADTWVPFRINVTPTQVLMTRVDTAQTSTVTDSTFRGPHYLFLGKKSTAQSGDFRNLVIT